jgi:general secretion pathway protein F
MAAFEYQAVDEDGKTLKGLIEADTARQARQQLRGMSLMPLEIGEVTSRESSQRPDPVAYYPSTGNADQCRATG